MVQKQPGGLSATAASPFEIYRNALDFVMSNLALDEDAAAEVILNELGAYADDGQEFGIEAVAGELGTMRLSPQLIDWRRAWLN